MRRYAANTAWFIRKLAAEVVPMNRIAELIDGRHDNGMPMWREDNTPDDFTEREKQLAELIGYSGKEQEEIVTELHAALVAERAELKRLVESLRQMHHATSSEREFYWRHSGWLERFIRDQLKLEVPKDSDGSERTSHAVPTEAADKATILQEPKP